VVLVVVVVVNVVVVYVPPIGFVFPPVYKKRSGESVFISDISPVLAMAVNIVSASFCRATGSVSPFSVKSERNRAKTPET